MADVTRFKDLLRLPAALFPEHPLSYSQLQRWLQGEKMAFAIIVMSLLCLQFFSHCWRNMQTSLRNPRACLLRGESNTTLYSSLVAIPSTNIPGLLQPLPIPTTSSSHISLDFVEGLPKSVSELPEVDSEGLFKIEPFAVLDSRTIRRKGDDVAQIWVQWVNSGPESATWEDLKYIRRKFPTFDPWGQGSIKQGGIVMYSKDESKAAELKKKGVLGEVFEGGIVVAKEGKDTDVVAGQVLGHG